jgi:hypothetical protein
LENRLSAIKAEESQQLEQTKEKQEKLDSLKARIKDYDSVLADTDPE